MVDKTTTGYHACNLCEAICGLEFKLQNKQIISIKGDKNDPLSKGHICPKAIALQDIYNDPDRLKLPIKNTIDGWKEIPWDQAFDEVADNIKQIQKQYGNNAVAIYQGNPTVHNLDAMLLASSFVRSVRTSNIYSATSVDQLPEQLVSLLMFGHSLMIPLPDLDRTDFIIIIGANPVVSNGSLMTAPGVKKRLQGIQKRNGKVVVIDPRKTETASMSDQHLFIKPGTDALMVLAMLQVVFSEQLVALDKLEKSIADVQIIKTLVESYTPEKVAAVTQVDAKVLKNLVREFCQSPTACCYGRIGVSTHEYGTLTQWLIVVFNIVTGNLDKPGTMMFSRPAFNIFTKASRKRKGFADKFSRVRNLPDFESEFPVATLAEEINTEGEGQIRALVTHAGNPVLSTPNGNQLNTALKKLDFMVSIDFYLNETTQHANIILPPLMILERPHYDIVFHALAIQNTARYSLPLFKADKKHRSGARIFSELTWRLRRGGLKHTVIEWFKKSLIRYLDVDWIVNMKLKNGPYGKSHGLTVKKLKQNPHGIDFGMMTPCLPKRLFTENKKINIAPEEIIIDLKRLDKLLHSEKVDKNEFDLLLIGRRDPRTNNSWLHNSQRMVKGTNRCTALISQQDAQVRGVNDGDVVEVHSRVGKIQIIASITDDIMQGVISIPHGWGHDMKGTRLSIANANAGVNTNVLTDDYLLDDVSGNAVLNGIPISLNKMDIVQ